MTSSFSSGPGKLSSGKLSRWAARSARLPSCAASPTRGTATGGAVDQWSSGGICAATLR
jgi:hypothetical protein